MPVCWLLAPLNAKTAPFEVAYIMLVEGSTATSRALEPKYIEVTKVFVDPSTTFRTPDGWVAL